jgi:hypothetical protein
MAMDFEWAYRLGAVSKQEGRPMVWETREVCEEMNHSRFVSLPLRLTPNNIENTSEHSHPLMHPTRHAAPPQCQRSPSLDNHTGA